jgi:hypothetical protein
LVNGVEERSVKVQITGSEDEGRPTGKQWVAELHEQNDDVPTGTLKLAWAQFETTQGNEEQIRLKAAANAELLRGARSIAAREQAPAAEGMGAVQPPALPPASYGWAE